MLFCFLSSLLWGILFLDRLTDKMRWMRNGKLLSLEDEKTVCKMLNNLSIECSMFDCPTRLKANYFMCQCWMNILRGGGEWRQLVRNYRWRRKISQDVVVYFLTWTGCCKQKYSSLDSLSYNHLLQYADTLMFLTAI